MFRSIFSKTLRGYRWAILGWGVGVGLLLYTQYATIGTQLTGLSSTSLQKVVEQFSFFGETVALNTPGGYVTFKTMGFLPVILGVWTVLVGARMTRGEEESGMLDILLSTPSSRGKVITQKALALAAATGMIALLMGVGLLLGMASAQASAPHLHIRVDVAAAFLAAFNAGIAAFLFGALALLLAQFMSRGAAAGIAGGLMALAYVVEGAGRAVASASGLRPLSPLYYYDRSLPLGAGHAMNWAAFALLVALSVGLVVVAAPLFRRRDIGRSVLADLRAAQPSARISRSAGETLARASREVWGRGVGVQSFRRQAVAMFWWIVGIAVAAGYLVIVAKTSEKQLHDLMSGSSLFQQLFSGADIGTNNGFLSVLVFGYIQVVVAIFIGLLAYRWTTDLQKGRLELVLSTPTPRWRVILERYAAVVAAAVAAVLAIWLAVILFAQASGFEVDAGRVFVASVGMLPLALVTASLVYALSGRLPPGLVIGIMSAFVAVSYLMDLLRTLLHLPGWALDFSIFHQYGTPMLSGLNWAGFAGMLAVAAALLALGGWQFITGDMERGATQE